MTSRALSAWCAIAFSLLAVLVAVDRPHWFGLQPGPRAAAGQSVRPSATDGRRSAPWLIARLGTADATPRSPR